MTLPTKPKNILLFLPLLVIFEFLFFNIKFSFLDFGTIYPAIFTIILVGAFGFIRHKKLNKRLLFVTLPLCSGFILATISYIENSPKADYYFVSSLFVLAILGLCSFSFFDKFSTTGNKFLLGTVTSALTLNAIMIIMMFMSSSFQSYYLSILSENNFAAFGGHENALNSMHKLRMTGLSGFASYSVGFAQVIGLFFLSAYYHISKKNIDLLFFTTFFLLIISAIISSRSSVFGIFLWFIFSLFFFGKRFFLSFIYLLPIGVVFMLILTAQMDADDVNFFINWIFDFFINSTESGSLAENISMLNTPFIDAGFYGFSRWFGDLGYDYFRSSDVGFIRVILAGGFGSLFLIALHFGLIGVVFFRGKHSVFLRTLYYFLILYLFIIMFKGAILFDFYAFDFLILMLCWIDQNKKINLDFK